jgi:hypothetical protein
MSLAMYSSWLTTFHRLGLGLLRLMQQAALLAEESLSGLVVRT